MKPTAPPATASVPLASQDQDAAGISPCRGSRKWTRPPGAALSLHASGLRGELWFRLQRNPGGLYVEREERPRHGRSCVQSLHFVHAGDFEHWCDDDPVRFEHPLLHVDLKRDATDLWELDSGSASDG